MCLLTDGIRRRGKMFNLTVMGIKPKSVNKPVTPGVGFSLRLTLFALLLISCFAGAQVHDSIPLIQADSLKTIYIFADTGKAMNRTDEQGRKQGLWEKRYANGKLRYKGWFKNDKPIGVFKYYWDNDSIQNITVYSRNGEVAHTRMFYQSGGIYATGKFVNRKMDSVWKYYSESSKLVSTEEYQFGNKEGKTITYYPDGTVMEIKNWHNGMLNGLWQHFYSDGQLQLQSNFVNNSKEGRFVTYDDGNAESPKVEGMYKNNERDGDWLFNTDDDAGTVDTLKYRNGVLTNPQRYEFTQHNLDSLKAKYHYLQEELDRGEIPGSGQDGGNFR